MRSFVRCWLAPVPLRVPSLCALALASALAACKRPVSSDLRDIYTDDRAMRGDATPEEMESLVLFSRSYCAGVSLGGKYVATASHCQPRVGADPVYSALAMMEGTATQRPANVARIIDYDAELDYSIVELTEALPRLSRVASIDLDPANIVVSNDFSADGAGDLPSDAPAGIDAARTAMALADAPTSDAPAPTPKPDDRIAEELQAAAGDITVGESGSETQIVAVGFPVDLEPLGMIDGVRAKSAKGSTMAWKKDEGLRVSAGLAPGNSGGPVFRRVNGRLRLVGLVLSGPHALSDPGFANHKKEDKASWGRVVALWQLFERSKFLQQAWGYGFSQDNADGYLKEHPALATNAKVLDDIDCKREALAMQGAPDGTPIVVVWSDHHVTQCGVVRNGNVAANAPGPGQPTPGAVPGPVGPSPAGVSPASGYDPTQMALH
jgi:hypothetical protein